MGGGHAVIGKEVNLPGGAAALLNRFDGARPGGALAVVDFPQIEQGLLHGTATGHAPVFHHAPVAVLLAVLVSFVGSQEHLGG